MNEFQIELDIKCSTEDVFAALINFERVPDWNSSVIDVKCSDAPVHEGSRVIYVGKFLGRKFTSEAQVTEFVPGTKYSSTTISGPFQLDISNTLTSTGAVTE